MERIYTLSFLFRVAAVSEEGSVHRKNETSHNLSPLFRIAEEPTK